MFYKKLYFALSFTLSFILSACNDNSSTSANTDIFNISCNIQDNPFKITIYAEDNVSETTVKYNNDKITTEVISNFSSQTLANESCKENKAIAKEHDDVNVRCEGKTVIFTMIEEGNKEYYESTKKSESLVCEIMNFNKQKSSTSKKHSSSSQQKNFNKSSSSNKKNKDNNVKKSSSSNSTKSSSSNVQNNIVNNISSSSKSDTMQDISSSCNNTQSSNSNVQNNKDDNIPRSSESSTNQNIESSSSSNLNINPEAFDNFNTEQCKGKNNGTKIDVGGIPFICMNEEMTIDEDNINELIGNSYKGCEDSKFEDNVWIFFSSPMGSRNTEKITWVTETTYEHKSFPVSLEEYEAFEELDLGITQIINNANRKEVYAKYCGN